MNRVITINLNGNAYQLEESGFEALRTYLDHAASRLEGNPDKKEIIADIEQAIADKFRAVLGVNKTVVVTNEVTGVVTEMGPVEDGSTEAPPTDTVTAATGTGPKAPTSKNGTSGGTPPKKMKRLYRLDDGAMLFGVCSGLARFLEANMGMVMPVVMVRYLFVMACFFYGLGVIVYVLLVVILPLADANEESGAVGGTGATAQEFIRRAKAGYYDGMKTLHDKQAHREWKRKFKQEMRGWKHGFQREMHENAQQWQQNWSQQWVAQHPRSWVGLGFTLDLLKWVRVLLIAFGLYAVYSLAKYGGVWGFALPAGIPAWIGIILVIVLYKFLTWPIKALRYACYRQGMGAPGWAGYACTGPMSSLVWLVFLAAAVWLADRFIPQFHELLKQVPPALHQAINGFQGWLER